MRWHLWVFASVIATGCAAGDGGDQGPPDAMDGYVADSFESDSMESEIGSTDVAEKAWWDAGDKSGLIELLDISDLFKERDWLILDASAWFEDIEHDTPGEVPLDSSSLGYYGIGNGSAFSFVGTWYPLNTLHELIGPDYQHDNDGYFADYTALLEQNAKALKWTREWIWKPLKAQVAVTRMQVAPSPLEMDTITFAPASAKYGPEHSCVVQVINVRNTGDAVESDVTVRVQSQFWANLVEDKAIEQTRGGDRMRVSPLGDGWTLLEKTADSDYPAFRSKTMSLEPGAEKQLVMVYEFAEEADPIGAGRDAVAAAGWGALLDATAAWWKAWHEKGLTIRTPDKRVNDLIEGLKATIKVQTADNGAATELSHYTGSWHRDVFPPVRTMLKFGYVDEARAMADYLYGAAAVKGGIGNALPADLDLPDPLPQRDWLAEVPFTSDRLRGEGPSFLPLMNLLVWRYTGEAKPLLDRWDYLIAALRGQTVTDEGLMHFSGDETFRVVYAFNIGLGLEWDFVHGAYSAYSGWLFVRACEMLADFIKTTGTDKADDLAWLNERAAFVRAATDDLYWDDAKGRYASMLLILEDDTTEKEPIPGEDLNTQPVWLGYHGREDDLAMKNLQGTMADILKDNGLLQTALGTDEELMGYPVGQGIQTGMTPGYFLYDGALMNLEVASKTFDAMGSYVSPSGNYSEVALFALPGRALCPVYDSTGGQGELWARYRQWEGAINLEAIMEYLLGFQADVVDGWLALAPRLAHASTFIEADRIMFNGHAFKMRYDREGDGFRMTLEGEGEPATYGLKEYRIRLNVPLDEVHGVKLDGKDLDPSAWTAKHPFPGLTEVNVLLPAKTSSFVLQAM
ncbi:MAG: hypothetical protein GXP54_10765 [Deltaproteobacteria bacterium]|nr:hypothetical protein [Deltaproteobacteria bacterium]